MKTFIPKIVITQQPGTDKPGFENEDGELAMLIDDDPSGAADDNIEDYEEMIYK